MNNILSKEFNKCIARPKNSGEFYTLQELRGKIIVKTSCGIENLNQFKNNINHNI